MSREWDQTHWKILKYLLYVHHMRTKLKTSEKKNLLKMLQATGLHGMATGDARRTDSYLEFKPNFEHKL